jgi:hypothetical protein
MLRIKINPSVEYYIKNDKTDKIMTILDVYNNTLFCNGSPNKLYVKHNDTYIDCGDITDFELNYKSMYGLRGVSRYDIPEYTYDEIYAVYSSGTFTLNKRRDLNENILTEQLNILDNVVFSMRIGNVFNMYTLLEIYHFMIIKCGFAIPRYNSNSILFIQISDKIYNISLVNLYINDRFILDYSFDELSDIQNSKNFIISPNSTISKIIPQEANIKPIENILTLYSCVVEDKKLFIVKNNGKDYPYPCTGGVLQLVINHYKPDAIVINRTDGVQLYQELLKFNLPIITK